MADENVSKATVIDTPEGIQAYRVLALKNALAMETMGLKRRGRSVYSIVKEEFGFKGSKKKVLEQLEKYIKDNLN